MEPIKDKINEALAKAQLEMEIPIKDKQAVIKYKDKNDKWHEKVYTYTSLPNLRKCVIPALNRNGITAYFRFYEISDKRHVECVLGHVSGQEITSFISIPMNIEKPQEIASFHTYYERYTLAGLCGMSSVEDDDGEIANNTNLEIKDRGPSPQNSHFAQVARVNETKSDDGPPPNDWSGLAGPEVNHTEPKSPVKTISEKQVKLLVAKAYGNKWTTKDIHQFFKAKFNVNELKELDWRMMDSAIVFVSKPFEQAMMDIGEIPF